MSSANGGTEARLRSLPSLPTERSRHGPCQAPALPNDAERLSAVIATQQKIATAVLDFGILLTRTAERTQAITGTTGAAVDLADGHGSPTASAFDPEWAGCGNRRSAHPLRTG
jgi:hypothetical protein